MGDSWFWVATGCNHSIVGRGGVVCAHSAQQANVLCCTRTPSHDCSAICKRRTDPSTHTANASAAHVLCAARGLRLCTKRELVEQARCCDKGCDWNGADFAARWAWTADACRPDECTDPSFSQVGPLRQCGPSSSSWPDQARFLPSPHGPNVSFDRRPALGAEIWAAVGRHVAAPQVGWLNWRPERLLNCSQRPGGWLPAPENADRAPSSQGRWNSPCVLSPA